MATLHTWTYAEPPNYVDNINKNYPYSEVPYLCEYNLVKIPLSYNKLIEHVDYWGEGRLSTSEGISGFANCYNINHVHQLVSNGSDINRKIPNRIPVISYTNCNTSGYIRDDSVELVTVMGAPINKSCAKDIERIINMDVGKVVVFGFDEDSFDIINLKTELSKKNMVYCAEYTLPIKLLEITSFNSYRAYLNFTDLCDYLYKNIEDANYKEAVKKTKILNDSGSGNMILGIITKLLTNGNKNVMSYAHQLWDSDARDVVTNYFPLPFQMIFKGEYVIILNKKHNLALKLDANTDSHNDRQAWGDSSDKTSVRVKWTFAPLWINDTVTFKIKNKEHGRFLKLDINTDGVGDRKAWGANNSNEKRFEWSLEPVMINRDLIFFIVNKTFNQALKLGSDVDYYNDRLLWGHNGSYSDNPEDFEWYIN